MNRNEFESKLDRLFKIYGRDHYHAPDVLKVDTKSLWSEVQRLLGVDAAFAEPETCEWTYDEFHDKWDTTCGCAHEFNMGAPGDNHYAFCPFCGKEIVEVNAVPDPDAEPETCEWEYNNTDMCYYTGCGRKIESVCYKGLHACGINFCRACGRPIEDDANNNEPDLDDSETDALLHSIEPLIDEYRAKRRDDPDLALCDIQNLLEAVLCRAKAVEERVSKLELKIKEGE